MYCYIYPKYGKNRPVRKYYQSGHFPHKYCQRALIFRSGPSFRLGFSICCVVRKVTRGCCELSYLSGE